MSESITVIADDQIPAMYPLCVSQPAMFFPDGRHHSGQPPDHVKEEKPTPARIIHPVTGYREVCQIREFRFDNADPDWCGRYGNASAGTDKVADDGYDPGGVTKSPVERSDDNFSRHCEGVHQCVFSDILIFVKIRLLFLFFEKKPVKFELSMRRSKLNQLLFATFLLMTLVFVSCGTSKNANCGCPNKKGMVGY